MVGLEEMLSMVGNNVEIFSDRESKNRCGEQQRHQPFVIRSRKLNDGVRAKRQPKPLKDEYFHGVIDSR